MNTFLKIDNINHDVNNQIYHNIERIVNTQNYIFIDPFYATKIFCVQYVIILFI